MICSFNGLCIPLSAGLHASEWKAPKALILIDNRYKHLRSISGSCSWPSSGPLFSVGVFGVGFYRHATPAPSGGDHRCLDPKLPILSEFALTVLLHVPHDPAGTQHSSNLGDRSSAATILLHIQCQPIVCFVASDDSAASSIPRSKSHYRNRTLVS